MKNTQHKSEKKYLTFPISNLNISVSNIYSLCGLLIKTRDAVLGCTCFFFFINFYVTDV